MDEPDIIAVNVEKRREVRATAAYLFVAITGSSLISGRTALKKAREVRKFVESLAELSPGTCAMGGRSWWPICHHGNVT